MNSVSNLIERGENILGNEVEIQLFEPKTSNITNLVCNVVKIYDYAINGCVMCELEDVNNNIYNVPLASVILSRQPNTKNKQEVYSAKRKIITYTLLSVEQFNNINAKIGFKVYITHNNDSTDLKNYQKISDKLYESHDEALKDGWKTYENYLDKNKV